MEIIAIVLSGLALIISLLSFIIVGSIAVTILKRSDSPIIQQNSDSDIDKYKETFEEGFKAGQRIMYDSLQLSIFDMFKKFEILDYEELFESILERIAKVLSDNNYREELTSEFNTYLGDTKNGNNPDDY